MKFNNRRSYEEDIEKQYSSSKLTTALSRKKVAFNFQVNTSLTMLNEFRSRSILF